MLFVITAAVFLSVGLGVLAAYLWLQGRKETLPQRIKAVSSPLPAEKRSSVLQNLRERYGRLADRFRFRPPSQSEVAEWIARSDMGATRKFLAQAGYRHPYSFQVYLWARILLPLGFALFAFLAAKGAGMSNDRVLLATLLALLVGAVAPLLFLRSKIRKRRELITDALPDALDLLVVCVEAGLGLNASFVKIAEEFRVTHPVLGEEFEIVNREMVAGKPRQEALRALSERTGAEEVKSLVAMLIQTEKLGTSLAQSLRVHSDALRTKRIQRAEEAAAKTTIKLVFPLVFLLFPALFIVLLGPGFLQIMKILVPTITGGG